MSVIYFKAIIISYAFRYLTSKNTDNSRPKGLAMRQIYYGFSCKVLKLIHNIFRKTKPQINKPTSGFPTLSR